MQNEAESPSVGAMGTPGGNPNNAPVGSVTGGVKSGFKNPQDNLIRIGEPSHFNFALAIAWLVALLAILATLYFWWLSKNTIDVVAEKQAKLVSIEGQIKAPAMVKVEKDSNDFKTSVGILSKAKLDRFSIAEFLPSFYTKITNDVKISSLSLSTDGALAISGTTKNYRTTADLVMALKSWSSLSNVDLSSVSMSTGEGTDGKVLANFSISAKVVKTPVSAATAASTTTSGTSGITAASPTTQSSTGGAQ